MNCTVMNLYSHSVLSLQTTMTYKLQSSLSYCTQGMFVIFLVKLTSPRNSEARRKHLSLYRTLFTSSVFLLLTHDEFFDAFQGKTFRLNLRLKWFQYTLEFLKDLYSVLSCLIYMSQTSTECWTARAINMQTIPHSIYTRKCLR